MPFEILGMPTTQKQRIRVSFIDPGYFSTLQIPLLQGRVWDGTENHNGRAVVVINQTFARRYFEQGSVIGRQVRVPVLKTQTAEGSEVVGVLDSDGWMQIIGIVGDSLNDGLDKPVQPAVYVPYTRFMWDSAQMLVRTEGMPLAALHSIRAAVQSVHSDQEVINSYGDLNQWLEQQPVYQQQRLFSILFGLFSGLALVLGLVGLYSVVSYSVAQRTNAFGIRMALGASRLHILWIVVRSVGVTIGCGLAGGFVLFAVLHRLLMHWTKNSDSNPMIPVAVALLFLLCAGLACIFPALRAASIDPMQALRYE
jgi:ABC-type antimicrobial peptide transport system permease subunit